jgi:GT2 family glycosyltransferase
MTTTVTIIVPTHNRLAAVEKTLASLTTQSYPLDLIDVLVVADGCTDGTDRMSIPRPLSGQVLVQPSRGPAAARNAGAQAARGDLLLFLDDDIEALPRLVEAHVRAHDRHEAPAVVVGYLPAMLDHRRDMFGIALRGWWHGILERMRVPGHRFTYADLLTGNCSVPAALFRMLGGFDESFRCHEDYEFGLRLLKAGGLMVFEPEAAGWHDDRTDLARAFVRKRDEGAADVSLAEVHPEVWPALPCARATARSRRGRALRTLALSRSVWGRLFVRGALGYATVLERLRLRGRWRALIDDLLWYYYWTGIAGALRGISFDALREQVMGRQPVPAQLPSIDLRHGLRASARELDSLDAPGVVLRYGDIHVGTVNPQPWAEPLAGRHLRRLLGTTFAAAFAAALETSRAVESGHVDDEDGWLRISNVLSPTHVDRS